MTQETPPPNDPTVPPSNVPPSDVPPRTDPAAPRNDKTNMKAIIGFVLSAVSLVVCCCGSFFGIGPILAALFAIAGAVTCGLAEADIRRTGEKGMGLAVAGRWIGIIMSILYTVLILAALIFGANAEDWLRDQGFDLEGQPIEETFEEDETFDDLDVDDMDTNGEFDNLEEPGVIE